MRRSPALGLLALVLGAGAVAAGDTNRRRWTPRGGAGRIVYEKYCASCHGVRGEGEPNWETLNARGELPSPPHSAEGHTWKHSDEMLYRMVSEGWRDHFNKTQRLTMPPFKDFLSPERSARHHLPEDTVDSEQKQFQWEETLVRGFAAGAC